MSLVHEDSSELCMKHGGSVGSSLVRHPRKNTSATIAYAESSKVSINHCFGYDVHGLQRYEMVGRSTNTPHVSGCLRFMIDLVGARRLLARERSKQFKQQAKKLNQKQSNPSSMCLPFCMLVYCTTQEFRSVNISR